MPGPSYAAKPQPEAQEEVAPAMTAPNQVKHVGGGWYELSNGDRVQGKDDAVAAEAAL